MTPVLRTIPLFLLLFSIMMMDTASAAGINTNVALPVRQGGLVYRAQVRWSQDSNLTMFPNAVLFGAGPGTTLFGVFPLIYGSGGRSYGMGDSRFLVRQTIYRVDSLQRTSRFALLGGLEAPTGKDRYSSRSTDYLVGMVYTLQSRRHELDVDLIRKFNTEGRGVTLGDELFLNVAYQLRIFPKDWPERGTPSQVYAVLEANGTIQDRTLANGVLSPDSGGTEWFVSPGLQYVTRRVIYEATIQIPAVRNLHGAQMATGWKTGAGVRMQF